jgi:DNA-binding transcriptional LysR family regulator
MLWFQVFREAVRCGSLGEASRTLGYTQSAVSRHIAALEAEYGVPLLERGPAGVRPTPYGERLLQHADAILAHDDQLRREFDGRVPLATSLSAPFRPLSPGSSPRPSTPSSRTAPTRH